MTDGPSQEQRRQLQAVGAASGLGCSIVVTLIALIGGGVLLDQRFDTTPVLTLAGVAVGLIAAGYQLYELSLIGRKDRPAGMLGRTIEQGVGARMKVGRSGSGSGSESELGPKQRTPPTRDGSRDEE